MKTSKPFFALLATLTIIGVISSSFAFGGKESPKGQFAQENKSAIIQALNNNDYEAWRNIVASPERFNIAVERHLVHQAELAKKLGITPEELKTSLESGKTIKEIAEEKGIDLKKHQGKGIGNPKNPEKLAEQLGISTEELKASLEGGKTIKEIAEEKGIELRRPQEQGGQQRLGSQGVHQSPENREVHLNNIAKKLDLSAEELQSALKEGKTIKELAEEKGVDLKRFGRLNRGNRGR